MTVPIVPGLLVAVLAAGGDEPVEQLREIALKAGLELDAADGARAADVEDVDDAGFDAGGLCDAGDIGREVGHLAVAACLDLDLFLVNRNGPDELLNNNLDGSFRPLAVERGLDGGASASRQVLLLDLDNDRDTDIITLKATPPHAVYLNELGWEYTPVSGADSFLNMPLQALVSGDTDANGLPELYALDDQGSVLRWLPMAGAPWVHTVIGTVAPATQPRLALQDIDGDGRADLLLSNGTTLEVRALQGDTLEPLYSLPAEQAVLAWATVSPVAR